MTTKKELPRYKCTKTIHALKIRFVNPSNNTLVFEEPGFPQVKLNNAFITKYQPYAGGYFVIYEDGYQSFSPPEPFENGYQLIE